MKTAANVAGGLAGITGLIQIALGVVFWTGHALALIPLHMLIGFVFVLALWTLCVLGARARLPLPSVLVALGWSLVVPIFGITQTQLLPGPAHWVIRVLHLLVGMIAMGQARGLTVRIRGVTSGRADMRGRSAMQPALPRS